jgi:uncharacterized protein (DUF1778 family)
MKRIKITLSPDEEARLKKAAAAVGLTMSAFVRFRLCEFLNRGDDVKAYIFTTRHWRELEAYCRMKNYISVEAGIPVLLDHAASQHKLSDKQKEEFERILEKLETPASFCETTAMEGK